MAALCFQSTREVNVLVPLSYFYSKDEETRRVWSLTKLYLHAHHFLYKLNYNSKWNTQEKYPLTSSREEARLIKGKVQRAEFRGRMEGGSRPGPRKEDGKKVHETIMKRKPPRGD